MGKRLAERGVMPDLILCSPAKRARATAKRIAKTLEYAKKNIVVNNAMYAASPAELLEIVHGLDDRIQTVCMVGHNPEMTIFANNLGKLNIFNVSTCGIVALEFDVDSWSDVGGNKGKLSFYDYPKNKAVR